MGRSTLSSSPFSCHILETPLPKSSVTCITNLSDSLHNKMTSDVPCCGWWLFSEAQFWGGKKGSLSRVEKLKKSMNQLPNPLFTTGIYH